jgi:photosystem II stability/assembly factor-like uncharacterized protein
MEISGEAFGSFARTAGTDWRCLAARCLRNPAAKETDFDFRGGHMKRFVLLVALIVSSASFAAAQGSRPKTATKKSSPAAEKTQQERKFKAIWEPVNYKEDLNFTDVFFASDDVGWVTGEHGTILQTKDGGKTWTPQIGGDPKSAEHAIHDLRFVDATHGWANQGSGSSNKLLRTTDGESWEEVGKLGGNYGYWSDYIFASENTGVQIRQEPHDIAQTLDSGKTWKKVLPKCAAKMEVEGLTREVGCLLKSLHFPSPSVGYAIGTGGKALFVLRTEDGGETWKTFVTPDMTEKDSTYFRQEVFFTTENAGFVTLSDGKILSTTDGGQTWHGLVGSSRAKIRFTDPEVGWSFDSSSKLTYSTNGGRTWSSRIFRFPASVKSFSFPSRQRAYVVGDHGMVYRYRVVPIDYTAKGMIDAPMMPARQ